MVAQIKDLLTQISTSSPTIKGSRIITIDGPAGSGKTTLAEKLAKELVNSEVVHMDDLYEGWNNTLTPYLSRKLERLLQDAVVTGEIKYSPYDWNKNTFKSEISFPLPDFLILEGVGSGQKIIRNFASYSIWIWAPPELRLKRGLERDGAHLRDEWLRFQSLEAEHFAKEQTASSADCHLSGAPSIQDAQ